MLVFKLLLLLLLLLYCGWTVWFPADPEDFFSTSQHPDRPWDPLSTLLNGYQGNFLRRKTAGADEPFSLYAFNGVHGHSFTTTSTATTTAAATATI